MKSWTVERQVPLPSKSMFRPSALPWSIRAFIFAKKFALYVALLMSVEMDVSLKSVATRITFTPLAWAELMTLVHGQLWALLTEPSLATSTEKHAMCVIRFQCRLVAPSQ